MRNFGNFSKFRTSTLLVGLAMTAAPALGTAGVIGFLGNFDVINDTGTTAHGFEIELESLHSADISDVFGGPGRGFPTGRGFDPSNSVERYGAPTISEYSNGASFGVRVTYLGVFDGVSWDYGTPSGTFVTPGDNCWSGGGVGYGPATPCDHFGVGTLQNPTKTTYNWLLETGTPGVLSKGGVNLPAPAWQVIPDLANPAAPPQVVAQIEAPRPEFEDQFGDAIWVKVYTTELEDEVDLEDLIGGNPVIDQAETEIEWQLLQTDPGNPAAGRLESGYGVPVGANARSIIRRYEFFDYVGPYDLETHEALVDSDSHPLESELGIYLGAQNAGLNLDMAIHGVDPVGVPAPSVLWLLGASLIGSASLRRRHV